MAVLIICPLRDLQKAETMAASFALASKGMVLLALVCIVAARHGANFTEGRGANFTGVRGANFTGGHCANCTGGRGTNFTGGRDANFTGGRGANFTGGRGANFTGGHGANFTGGRGANFTRAFGANFTVAQYAAGPKHTCTYPQACTQPGDPDPNHIVTATARYNPDTKTCETIPSVTGPHDCQQFATLEDCENNCGNAGQ